MKIMSKNQGLGAVSLAVLMAVALPTTPAMAQAVRDKVLATIADAAKASGAKEVTWGAVTGDDAKFTVADSKIVVEQDGKATTITAESTTYTGAKLAADGSYSVDEIAVSGLDVEGDDSEISIATAKIAGYVGQSADKIRAKTTTGERFDKIDLGEIETTTEDDKTISIASLSLGAADYAAGIPHKTSFALKGLVVPIEEGDESTKDLAELGYTKLSIDASFNGLWDDKTGKVTVDPLAITAADVGGVKLSFVVGGLTPETIDALKKAEKDNAKQMELLQGLTVEKLTLRYEDASFAKRLLDSQAKKQGVPSDAMVQQLNAMLPMVLASIGNKDFEKKVAGAAGNFLKTPKSLTVSALPAKPISVSEIMGAAMMAPQSLPTVLGADVKSND